MTLSPQMMQGTLAQIEMIQPETSAPETQTLLIIWISLGVLAVIIQALMAIWVVKDARSSSKSPGWAAFVAIPGIGLIGLLIYILIPGGPTQEEIAHQQELMGMKQELDQMREQNRQSHADAERARAEAANQKPLSAPAMKKHTMVISAVPSRVVSLTQFGGRNHGMTFTLRMLDPTGTIRRNYIGREASCDLSFPEDDCMSSQHCMLLDDGEEDCVCVIDLGSANGTILERDGQKGKVNAKTSLKDGDYIVLGDTRLRVLIIEPEDTPEAIPEFTAN